MTLHKIIITHIAFYNYKKIIFKQIKHMMHSKHTQLLCRHLFNYCADTRGVTVKLHNPPSSIVSGILKREWAVLPPGMMEAATPDVAVATASLFSLRTLAS